jgi:hypothetical protein
MVARLAPCFCRAAAAAQGGQERKDDEMPKRAEAEQARLEVHRRIRERQEEVLRLDRQAFVEWCWDVAQMRVDSIPGLLHRVRRMGRGWSRNERLEALLRAEEAVVDQLDRAELRERLYARRLTGYQCEYWYWRRPTEVPTVDGHPVWLAAKLADVVD